MRMSISTGWNPIAKAVKAYVEGEISL